MTVNEILNTARNEIGYREGANNDNKYGIEYGMNNEPWCVIFLWWCFRHSNAGDLFPNTAHCDGVRSHAKAVGGWLDRAELESAGLKPGDLVIWDYNSDGSGARTLDALRQPSISLTANATPFPFIFGWLNFCPCVNHARASAASSASISCGYVRRGAP